MRWGHKGMKRTAIFLFVVALGALQLSQLPTWGCPADAPASDCCCCAADMPVAEHCHDAPAEENKADSCDCLANTSHADTAEQLTVFPPDRDKRDAFDLSDLVLGSSASTVTLENDIHSKGPPLLEHPRALSAARYILYASFRC